MLSKVNRITKKKDFEAIFKKGKIFKEGFLILRIFPNSLNVARTAFVVSQKVSKKAVVRNKIRRRAVSLIRPKLQEIKNGLDLVFIVLPGFEKKNFSETQETIESILKKAKIIKNV
jgi:ribonuclease P protein component